MVIDASSTRLSGHRERKDARGRITVFHCANAAHDIDDNYRGYVIHGVELPCSSLIVDVVLLKAFEAGADAVVVLACPEGSCRHIDGNLRAGKRVGRVKKILDDIGLDGRRLIFRNVSPGDGSAVKSIVAQTALELENLGPAIVR